MARELLAGGQRESAKVLIRRKRVLEAQVASTVAKLDAVENSLSTIEGTEMTEAVLEAVERGNKAVETLNARVTVERVENAMAADANAQAYVDEVSTALGLFDEKEACEEEVLADLAEFEKEHGIASATNTDTGVNGAVNGRSRLLWKRMQTLSRRSSSRWLRRKTLSHLLWRRKRTRMRSGLWFRRSGRLFLREGCCVFRFEV